MWRIKMKLLILTFSAAVLLFGGFFSSSIAGHHYHGCGYMTDMSKIDTNKDGMLTFDEFSATETERLKSAYRMLDTNKDEVISKEEWNEFLKVHGFGEYKDDYNKG